MVVNSKQSRFQNNTLSRNEECDFIMIKESIHQEDITIQTIYVPNRNSKYKQTEYRGIKVRGFKIFLLRIDRKTRQKISKDLNDLNNTINKLNLNQIF